jgi:hypothetical protein
MAEHPLTRLARVRVRLDEILAAERRRRARAGSRRVLVKVASFRRP